MQNQPWTKENNTTRRPKKNSSREQDGVKDQAGALTFVREDAAAILSHFSAASAGKEAPGEPPGAAGAGEAGPENPKNSAEKEFPGAEGGDLNKRHS